MVFTEGSALASTYWIAIFPHRSKRRLKIHPAARRGNLQLAPLLRADTQPSFAGETIAPRRGGSHRRTELRDRLVAVVDLYPRPARGLAEVTAEVCFELRDFDGLHGHIIGP